ncbi:hypothetical protein H3H54_01775 [Brachybacterium sp. Z12]|uniref:hypothetical protein n=1 Tax=Brachybacterium sp. Z12 TaxID=2759167 RepID=UPI001862BE05|nr:hypothetical protein [Brachybacterium sp. Z12]QNN82707.1 hypothetical protein H3H54_01775 [Brachybacterium sp. Z12]
MTGTKPLTAYFRRSFTVDDATQVAALELTTRADDGVVVYVNGTEVARSNMPTGSIGHGTYASAAPNAAAALANPVTVTVPGDLLVSGENVITAEVHLNYRSSPTASFELTAEAAAGEPVAPLRATVAEEPTDTAPAAEAAQPPADEPEAASPRTPRRSPKARRRRTRRTHRHRHRQLPDLPTRHRTRRVTRRSPRARKRTRRRHRQLPARRPRRCRRTDRLPFKRSPLIRMR